MKLKWLSFSILWLIGWLILLPNFSSAWNSLNPVWLWEDLWSENYCLVASNLSFQCSESDNILTSQDWTRSVSYFWLDNWLWIYQYSSNSNYYWQWIMTWFQFCSNTWEYFLFNYWDWSSCLWRVYNYQEFRNYASTHSLQYRWRKSHNSWKGFWWPVFVFEDWTFRATADSVGWTLTLLKSACNHNQTSQKL